MSDRVALTIEGHIAEVMLNRPAKFNALDIETFRALDDVARRLDGESAVRVVVLHGAGKNFCSGIDIESLQAGGEEIARELLAPVDGSPANLAQRAAYAWRELPVPVICAMHGIVFGGGLQIALGADVRIAASDTQMSIMESKWGLIPDMAISTTLRGLVAPDVAKELAFSARVFDADEALRLGVIARVEDDPLTAARELAGMIAARSPDAMRGIKRLFNESGTLSEADALALEARIQVGILRSPNQAEAVLANLEKRAPKFVD
jgi:enoyl-CoA hydratase/carnithine racemase